ncbi:MAG: hypothetical protein HZC41_15280 [Chloroflexi bacterium]|nr:hypothetical protein [Chloroflexota bacterium]
MVWALVFVLLMVIVVMALSNSEHIPWLGKLRRIHAGVAHKAEWMAPDDVVEQVRADYLAALDWLQTSVLEDPARQLAQAARYLNGAYLRRYQTLFQQYYTGRSPRFVGVMRADHEVQVRHFSEDGRRCLVIDAQTQRRMATYDRRRDVRLHTQDLGEGAVVYQMAYDSRDKRWKIEAFIQELPAGWVGARSPRLVRLSLDLPAVSGRDN